MMRAGLLSPPPPGTPPRPSSAPRAVFVGGTAGQASSPDMSSTFALRKRPSTAGSLVASPSSVLSLDAGSSSMTAGGGGRVMEEDSKMSDHHKLLAAQPTHKLSQVGLVPASEDVRRALGGDDVGGLAGGLGTYDPAMLRRMSRSSGISKGSRRASRASRRGSRASAGSSSSSSSGKRSAMGARRRRQSGQIRRSQRKRMSVGIPQVRRTDKDDADADNSDCGTPDPGSTQEKGGDAGGSGDGREDEGDDDGLTDAERGKLEAERLERQAQADEVKKTLKAVVMAPLKAFPGDQGLQTRGFRLLGKLFDLSPAYRNAALGAGFLDQVRRVFSLGGGGGAASGPAGDGGTSSSGGGGGATAGSGGGANATAGGDGSGNDPWAMRELHRRVAFSLCQLLSKGGAKILFAFVDGGENTGSSSTSAASAGPESPTLPGGAGAVVKAKALDVTRDLSVGLLSSMRRFTDDGWIQLYGSAALGALAGASESCRGVINALGAVEVVAAASKRYFALKSVQRMAAVTLRQLDPSTYGVASGTVML